MRIRTQIFISFLILTSAGFYFFVDWLLGDVKPHYRESTEDPLVDTSTVLAALAGTFLENDNINVANFRAAYKDIAQRKISAQIYDFLKNNIDLRVYVTNRQGLVLFDSLNGRDEGKDYSSWRDVSFTLRGEYGARTSRDDPQQPDQSVLYVAAPIYSKGEIAGVLSVGKPTRNANALIAAAETRIIRVSILVFLIVSLLSLWLSRRLTKPIQRLTDYARSVRDGKRAAYPHLGKSEVAELGKAFEEMRETIEGKNYIESYVQTLTHELKSPLSGIRAGAELLQGDLPAPEQKRFLNNILSESARIQLLVDKLLLLSSLQTKRRIEGTEFSLRDLLAELKQILEVQIREKQISLALSEAPDKQIIYADRFLIQQALLNLLQNAIDFSFTNGRIDVRTVHATDAVRVIIEDCGSGIPEYALSKVFDSFFSLQRPATGRKSSGLGLSLVKEVAELHNGEIIIENRPPTGVKASFTIPIKAQI